MIDSETGLPYAFPPDASSASTAAGGISPLLLALMQQQGGPGMQQLLQYFLNGPGAVAAQPASAVMQPGVAQQQPSLPLGYGGTQPDPLTLQQRAFMGYGGPGQPVDWYAAMGMPGGMNNGAQGAAAAQPIYQAQSSAQASTPQDFVTQWQRMFGSK